MRTLLVSVLALGLVAILVGCEPTSQRPTRRAPSAKAPEKTAPASRPREPTGRPAATATVARAVAPKGPSVPPVAGKAVEGKFVHSRRLRLAGRAYTDKNGVVWSADGAYNATRKYGYIAPAAGGDTASHPMDALDPLYATERWGMTSLPV